MNPQKSDQWSCIGHAPHVNALQASLDAGHVNHALIFAGPRHVGKAHVARWFLGQLLGGVDIGTHPDAVILTREVNPKTKKLRELISIEQVHAAREAFARSSMMGGYKVMLVEDAERLSESAANALLKTLEEPRGKACIILTTTNAQQLLPTIRSRAELRTFHLVPEALIAEKIGDAELAAMAQGSPGVAIAAQNDAEVYSILRERFDAARACLSPNSSERILAARNLLPSYKEDHVVTRTELLERLSVFEGLARQAMHRGLAGQQDADTLTPEQAARALTALKQTRESLARHINPKLSLIQLMLTIA